tara:strand:+ start:515 stop:727 length:213 start_codon:yes stop_codon:yes gene_type:complete
LLEVVVEAVMVDKLLLSEQVELVVAAQVEVDLLLLLLEVQEHPTLAVEAVELELDLVPHLMVQQEQADQV